MIWSLISAGKRGKGRNVRADILLVPKSLRPQELMPEMRSKFWVVDDMVT